MWLSLLAATIRTTPTQSVDTLAGEVVSVFGPSGQMWEVGLVFLRISTMVMLVPGLGNQEVPPRLRIGFALLLAMIVHPLVEAALPPLPVKFGALAGAVIFEVLIGLMLGMVLRILLFTLLVAGEIMSLQTTLSFAQTANPAQAQPSTSLGTFLGLVGLVMIYVTGTHHLFFRAMIDSYILFAPGKAVIMGDVFSLIVEAMRRSFLLAIQLSAPLLVFGIVFHAATGFVGRIMPNFPIFFAATPVGVLLGLSILAMSIGTVGMVFIDHYREFIGLFIRQG